MGTTSTTPLQELSADERLEYEQLGHWARHDDTMIYQAASTILPLAFGSLAVAVQFPKMAMPLAVFSFVLYAYWLLISVRLSWFSSVRLERMRELELKAGLEHHFLLKSPPNIFASGSGARLSIRKVRWLGLVVLGIAWLVVLSKLAG